MRHSVIAPRSPGPAVPASMPYLPVRGGRFIGRPRAEARRFRAHARDRRHASARGRACAAHGLEVSVPAAVPAASAGAVAGDSVRVEVFGPAVGLPAPVRAAPAAPACLPRSRALPPLLSSHTGLQAADAALTTRALSGSGYHEANPVMAGIAARRALARRARRRGFSHWALDRAACRDLALALGFRRDSERPLRYRRRLGRADGDRGAVGAPIHFVAASRPRPRVATGGQVLRESTSRRGPPAREDRVGGSGPRQLSRRPRFPAPTASVPGGSRVRLRRRAVGVRSRVDPLTPLHDNPCEKQHTRVSV